MLAAIRTLNRLELLGETMRAALNEVAAANSAWLQDMAPAAWYERYGHRIEERRLPRSASDREALALQVGQDGFTLLVWL